MQGDTSSVIFFFYCEDNGSQFSTISTFLFDFFGLFFIFIVFVVLF